MKTGPSPCARAAKSINDSNDDSNNDNNCKLINSIK